MSKSDILATYSPCCGMVRIGQQTPGVMHSGMCRERNGGSLGPTIYLMESYRVPREPPHCCTCSCGMEHTDGRLRTALVEAYSLWSRDQGDGCETANKMADIINAALDSSRAARTPAEPK